MNKKIINIYLIYITMHQPGSGQLHSHQKLTDGITKALAGFRELWKG